jgi:predicted TIM-barrel fold metal-dependent hydrolase
VRQPAAPYLQQSSCNPPEAGIGFFSLATKQKGTEKAMSKTKRDLNALECKLYDVSKRRTIYAKLDAQLTGCDVAEVRKAIRVLAVRKLIFQSDRPIRNYYGSTDAGYRAVQSLTLREAEALAEQLNAEGAQS